MKGRAGVRAAASSALVRQGGILLVIGSEATAPARGALAAVVSLRAA
jgi:hypothetical protein